MTYAPHGLVIERPAMGLPWTAEMIEGTWARPRVDDHLTEEPLTARLDNLGDTIEAIRLEHDGDATARRSQVDPNRRLHGSEREAGASGNKSTKVKHRVQVSPPAFKMADPSQSNDSSIKPAASCRFVAAQSLAGITRNLKAACQSIGASARSRRSPLGGFIRLLSFRGCLPPGQ